MGVNVRRKLLLNLSDDTIEFTANRRDQSIISLGQRRSNEFKRLITHEKRLAFQVSMII
jgi:hypothetical protein